MTIDDAIELAVIQGSERGLRRAATRASEKATKEPDGAKAEKHRRDAAAWAVCADDVAAMAHPVSQLGVF